MVTLLVMVAALVDAMVTLLMMVAALADAMASPGDGGSAS